MGRWTWRAGLLALLVAASSAGPLTAQLAPLSVPRGAVRLELGGDFESWDHQFVDGNSVGIAAAFESDSLGAGLIPSLTTANQTLARITGDPGAALILGRSRADAEINRDIGIVGLGIGITNRLTLFGRLPAVRSRVQSTFRISDDPATAGLNPGNGVFGTAAGSAQDAVFFQEFGTALSTLDQQISTGAFDSDPARKAAAQATLSDATALRNDLFNLFGDPTTALPFAPLAYSDLGHAVTARVNAVQTALAQFGVGGFDGQLALSATPLDAAAFSEYLTNPAGPIGALPLGELVTARPGDAEVGMAYTITDRWDRGEHRGGIRVAVEGLVRLPTGHADSPIHFLDAGTGDHQMDLQGRVVADVGSGLLGARITGLYNRQLANDAIRLVASPLHPVAPKSQLAELRIDPGDETAIGIEPFVRLGRTFAFLLGATYTHRGADAVNYSTSDGAIPGVDATIVAEGTAWSMTVLRAGFTFADLGALRPGGKGLPLDASWTWEKVIAASDGIVPQKMAIRARLRIYVGMF